MFLDRSKCRGKSIKITSFWDQFSTILFPFKYKFLPFLETKRAIVVREFFLSFSFWGCLLSKKISSKFFKKIFLNGFLKWNELIPWTLISHSFGFGWKLNFFLMELQGEGRDQVWKWLQICSWRWRHGGEVWRRLSSSAWGIGDLELGKSLYTLIDHHSRIFYWL